MTLLCNGLHERERDGGKRGGRERRMRHYAYGAYLVAVEAIGGMGFAQFRGMTALLWVILSFFVTGFFWMVSEIIKAPEGVEDSQGFRVVRASTAVKANAGKVAAPRGLHWAARRA
jgi:hypothetical protein